MLRTMHESVTALARRYVDLIAERGGECDFVGDVAVHYPLRVILSLLGLPESDFPRLLTLNPVEGVPSTFVSGLKHLPIRYRLGSPMAAR